MTRSWGGNGANRFYFFPSFIGQAKLPHVIIVFLISPPAEKNELPILFIEDHSRGETWRWGLGHTRPLRPVAILVVMGLESNARLIIYGEIVLARLKLGGTAVNHSRAGAARASGQKSEKNQEERDGGPAGSGHRFIHSPGRI